MTLDELTAAIRVKAEALSPGEGFFISDLVVARSPSGRLWAGGGMLGSVYWWRGTGALDAIGEYVGSHTDWRTAGYAAGAFRREAEWALTREPLRLTGIGRTQVMLANTEGRAA